MYPILFINQVIKAYHQQLETKGKPARVLHRRSTLEVKDSVSISREARELLRKSRLQKA